MINQAPTADPGPAPWLRLTVGQRLFLAVIPAVLAVVLVAGLGYYGQYARVAPAAVVVGAGVLAVASLAVTWWNVRYLAGRIGRLAGARPAATPGAPDELDRIEATVDRLGTALSAEAEGRAREQEAAAARLRQQAALLAATSESALRQLDELRLPLHILLDNRFGELNPNQEELLADARAAGDAMDAELRRLREIADADRGALVVRRELVQLNDAVRAALPVAVAAAARRGARASAALEPGLPRVVADRARLYEAVALLFAALSANTRAGDVVTAVTRRDGGRAVLRLAAGQDGAHVPNAAPAPDHPDLALARRLLEAQGAAVAIDGPEVEVVFG